MSAPITQLAAQQADRPRPIEIARIRTAADTIADTIAIRVPVPAALRALRGLYDAVVSVSEQQLFDAMLLLRRHLGHAVEPAGAAGVAAILADPAAFAGQRVATILCGANLAPALAARLEDAAA